MRILMITHEMRSRTCFRPHVMARILIERGHHVSLIVTSDRRRMGIVESNWRGVPVIETPDLLWGRLRSGWDPWNHLNRLAYLAREQDSWDLIHCFETRPATIHPALFYCWRNRLPMVTDWNDWWGRGGIIDILRPRWYRILLGGVETFYEEAFRARGAGLTVISTALARRAVGLGMDPKRILHIPGGTFPDWFPVRSIEECRRRVGLPVADPIIGFSSLDSHLDLDVVFGALAVLLKDFPSAKLMITGRTRPAVLESARVHGVENNIYLTGFLSGDDLPWYLGCANLFAMPFPDTVYNVGRWPNKIGEYMSLGRPTVTNPVGDVKGLFESHQIGLLAKYDAMDFASKIKWLLDNPATAAELGANARQVAVTEYDWKLLTGNLEQFYRRVLEMESQKPVAGVGA